MQAWQSRSGKSEPLVSERSPLWGQDTDYWCSCLLRPAWSDVCNKDTPTQFERATARAKTQRLPHSANPGRRVTNAGVLRRNFEKSSGASQCTSLDDVESHRQRAGVSYHSNSRSSAFASIDSNCFHTNLGQNCESELASDSTIGCPEQVSVERKPTQWRRPLLRCLSTAA